jgi:hypothetical protein
MASSRKPEPRIKIPADEDLLEVVATLKLRDDSAALLCAFVIKLAKDIRLAVSKGDHDLTALRRRRRSFVHQFSKHLDMLCILLKRREATALRGSLAQELGDLLSTHAFEQRVEETFCRNVSRCPSLANLLRPREGSRQISQRLGAATPLAGTGVAG